MLERPIEPYKRAATPRAGAEPGAGQAAGAGDGVGTASVVAKSSAAHEEGSVVTGVQETESVQGGEAFLDVNSPVKLNGRRVVLL